jgi:RNA-directed DNA polymerase
MLLFLTPLCTLVANFCVLIVAKSSALLIAKNSALLLTDYTTPFDPAYSIYFEERITSKMSENKEGRAKIVALWRRQKGHCSICSEKITSDTGWFIHYLESRTQGGQDNLSNLQLIHKNCYRD